MRWRGGGCSLRSVYKVKWLEMKVFIISQRGQVTCLPGDQSIAYLVVHRWRMIPMNDDAATGELAASNVGATVAAVPLMQLAYQAEHTGEFTLFTSHSPILLPNRII